MNDSNLRLRRAFTLTELMVVVALIAILIALLLPVLGGARSKAWAAQCANQERQIGAALLAYANDNQGHLPKPPPLLWNRGLSVPEAFAWTVTAPGQANFDSGTLVNYLGSSHESRERLMKCPADTGMGFSPWQMSSSWNFTYGLNAFLSIHSTDGQSRRVTNVREPSSKILVWEMRGPVDGLVCFCGGSADEPAALHSGKGNFAFIDGHVEPLSPSTVARPEYFRMTGEQTDCGTHWYHP